MSETASKIFDSGGKEAEDFKKYKVLGRYSEQFGHISTPSHDHREPLITEETPAPPADDIPKSEPSRSFPRDNNGLDIIKKIRDYHKGLDTSNLPRLTKSTEEMLARINRYLSPAEGNLKVAMPNGNSIYITSCFPKEGKTTSAIALAYNLAVFTDRTVLLVDAHFSASVLHLVFNVAGGISFKDVLLNPSLLIQGILPTVYDNLFVLPNMSQKDHSAAGITPDTLDNFIKSVSAGFDYVIIDGRPILSAPEPIFFASVVDGVILVVESERTKWEVVQSTTEKINNIKAKIAGVVLNKRRLYIPPAVYKIL